MTSKQRFQLYPFTVLLCLCLTEGTSFSSNESCRKIDDCSCVLKNGEAIDLHFSDHSQNGVPVFHYQSSSFSEFFKYSPCKGLPCGGDLPEASLCIMNSSFQHSSVEIGTLSSAQFLLTGENVTLMYVTNDSQRTLTSLVQLQCSHSVEQFLLDSNTSDVYRFTLRSRCACPGLCRQSGGGGEVGMSTGTILLLIFFPTLILYFGVGCMYRKAVYGAESWMEMVPHQTFWFSLPSLIRDGYLFFISPCIGNRAEYHTYDKL